VGGDDTVGYLGVEGVAPGFVVEGDDANLSEAAGAPERLCHPHARRADGASLEVVSADGADRWVMTYRIRR
jgi:hypothetical protein